MKKIIFFSVSFFLICMLLCGCGAKNSGMPDASHEEFLELPGFSDWGMESYDLIVWGCKTDAELRAEGMNDEDIANERSYDVDAIIKELAANRTAKELGTSADNAIVFRLFVDEFYDDDISSYFTLELAELSSERLKELGFSDELFAAMEDYRYVRDHRDLSDEELAAYGFNREEAEFIRNGGETYYFEEE